MFLTFTKALFADATKHPLKKHLCSGADNLGAPGSGAGRGGGGGGTIRQAGGSLGKYGAVKEEEYFYKLQKEQLEDLQKKLEKRRKEYERELGKVEDIIERNRKAIAKLNECFRKKK